MTNMYRLPVELRIQFKILLSFYSSAPCYLTKLLVPYAPIRSLRSLKQQPLIVPKSKRKTRGDPAFPVLAPRLRNAPLINIRSASSTQTLKSRICFGLLLTVHDQHLY